MRYLYTMLRSGFCGFRSYLYCFPFSRKSNMLPYFRFRRSSGWYAWSRFLHLETNKHIRFYRVCIFGTFGGWSCKIRMGLFYIRNGKLDFPLKTNKKCAGISQRRFMQFDICRVREFMKTENKWGQFILVQRAPKISVIF